MALIVNAIFAFGSVHRSVEVGKMEESSSKMHGERLIRIEGIEPDARSAGIIMNIGPDIHLKEI